MEIKATQQKIYATAKSKGWYDKERTFGDVITLVHSELSEAYEEYRNGHEMVAIRIEKGKPEGIPVELADAVIRIFDCAEHYGIDLEAAIELKMWYNEKREYRHGNKVS